jgi:DegV family protein with EDD domain
VLSEPIAIGYIDGIRLRRALQAGIHRVLSRQDHLNRINVFPVPDGDTGTNIAFTLNAVLARLSASAEQHVGRLLTQVADAALDGARGNSGAILAQFFQGLSDAAAPLRAMDTRGFSQAVTTGADYAREALAEPREGTLLTVLADFAHELGTRCEQAAGDFRGLLETGLKRAESSLAETPAKLAVLKRAGVVDAGAAGFVELLRGVIEFVQDGSLRGLPDTTAAPTDGEEAAGGAEPASRYRFCTECLVEGSDIDRRHLREALGELGDSLVLAGSKRKAKVHIHVNDPDEVFRIAERFGSVSGQKADDMHQQQASAHARHERAVIVTDSGADIPESELERLDIHMVPVRVNFGAHSYLDKVTLTPAEFYRELRSNPAHPQTSQPAPGDFRRQFQFLASHYEAVVSINLTARVSGTWQSAQSAAARAEGDAVTVIDSLNVSTGQGLLTMYAAECAQAGLPTREVIERVSAARATTFTWGVLRDLTWSVRGGRVSKSTKLIADLLHLTPVLKATADGRIVRGGLLLGHGRILDKFAAFVARRARGGVQYRLAVGHCACAEDGEALRQRLLAALPDVHSSYLMEVGPALGTHAGPGALVVSLQEYQPPVADGHSGD